MADMGSHITANGLKIWVQDSGPQPANKGTVVLFHGFPDTSDMWQPQIQALNAAGYRTIAPDLPGLGQSDKPTDLSQYNFQTVVTPAMVAVLDALSVDKFSVVGHDFGSGLAWGVAFMCPNRVERLVVLSVGYMGTYFTAEPLAQRKVSWYIPFNMMQDAEEAYMANDWQFFRAVWSVDVSKDRLDAIISRLSEPGALTSALNLYRGNFSAALFANTTPIPPPFKLSMPVLGLHPSGDVWCLEGQMKASQLAVEDSCWQFKSVPGGHWFFVEEPEALNKLLLEFLG